MDARALVRECHRAAVDAVNGRQAVAQALVEHPLAASSVHLIAIGKAASAMAHGAADQLSDQIVGGLVITREGYDDANLAPRIPVRTLTAPHPIPDARSLDAGETLVNYLANAPADAHFLFLISGGASSLVERLADEGQTKDLARLNEWLMASGWDITRMNQLRKAVSSIKGGRLAQWLAGRAADVLLISDVPGDDPAVIGSGLLFADRNRVEANALVAELPFPMPLAKSPPRPDDPMFARVHAQIVASNSLAIAAAAHAGRAAGWPVHCPQRFLDGPADALGVTLADELLNTAPGLLIWGGEPTVTLPARPGRGGRMQTLALAASARLAGHPAVLLAAGTDGADGPGEDAGAIVDGGSQARGEAAGLDRAQCLAAADAGRFLHASGDLIQTGSTGTNVMDLVIGFQPGVTS